MKDLRIEQAPTTKENKPPQVPNDPAILGVSAHIFYNIVQTRVLPKKAVQIPYVMKEFRMLIIIVSESAKPCGDFPLPSF